MANALPQAIGAQLLYPNRQVIALCGDGGFAMLMGGLLTVLQYDLPLKILIFNNSQLDLVKMEMEVAGYPEYQTDLKNPNFAKVAEAVGFLGIRIEDPADVRPGLQKMLAHPGPVVVDVITDPNALALPPHIEFDQVKGYALSMTRLMLSGRADEVVDIIQSNRREYIGGTLGCEASSLVGAIVPSAALSEFTLVGVLPSLGAFLLIWAYLARTRKIQRSGVDHQD